MEALNQSTEKTAEIGSVENIEQSSNSQRDDIQKVSNHAVTKADLIGEQTAEKEEKNGNTDCEENSLSVKENGFHNNEIENDEFVVLDQGKGVEKEGMPGEINSRVDIDNEHNSQQNQNKAEGNVEKSEGSENEDNIVSSAKSLTPRKARRRGIFVSYSPDASLEEKLFVCYTIRELKNIGFCDDVWFDKDEIQINNPTCFQQRIEIAEKCRASLMFLSESYFSSRPCKYEATILLGREKSKDERKTIEKPVKLFCVKYDDSDLPHEYKHLQDSMVDLSGNGSSTTSIAEKSSSVVASFSEEMEKFAPLFGLRAPSPPREPETPKEFLKKNISSWNFYDVQEWLTSLKIHPRFTLSFEENQIDGFLLLAISEDNMETQLGVDSRVVRKKIMQQIRSILDKESQERENWFLKLKKVKGKNDSVYMIFDPSDARLVQNMKRDIVKKNLQVYHHNRLGQSKDEFLQLNGRHMAVCHSIIVVMTIASASSLFVYNEIVFAEWLGKPIMVAMFNNSWHSNKPGVQSILGGCPSVDFENSLYSDSLDVLMYHIKPLRHMPAVILEQDFLDRMADGVKPLQVLVSLNASNAKDKHESAVAKIFFSYHWDVQNKVQTIVQHLQKNNFECWTDITSVAKQPSSCAVNTSPCSSHDSLQSQIQRNMKAAKAVVCCVTQKYICSDNCSKDLALAELLHKPIIPLLLQWITWPPESGAAKVRKILAPQTCIDMSNEKLFKRNLHSVVTHLKRLSNDTRASQEPSIAGDSIH